MNKTATLISCTVLILISSIATIAAPGDDYWPAWRGPKATGAALKGNPPITWSETENIKWKVKLPGQGQSTPVIWENKMFFLVAIPATNSPTPQPPASRNNRRGRGSFGRGMSQQPQPMHKFDVVCMDRNTGKILWQKTAAQAAPHEGHHGTGSFAAYSPITDGKLLWAGFGSRGIHCYDVDGNHKWSKDLGKLNIIMSFGEGCSPTLAGDALIVNMDHEGDSFIYALDKNTGDILWKKPREEKTSWATPLPIEVNGKLQVITSATGLIRSYDAKTGDIIWQCSGMTSNVIPSPVTDGKVVYCISGYRGSALLAIKLGQTGDLTNTDAVLWKINEATPYVPSPLLYEGRLYFCSVNKANITCCKADTGQVLYTGQSLEGLGTIYASPTGAAGRIYFIDRNGNAIVIKSSDKHEVLATNKLDDNFDASPVVVGDQLYLKGHKYLYCIAKI